MCVAELALCASSDLMKRGCPVWPAGIRGMRDSWSELEPNPWSGAKPSPAQPRSAEP